MYGLVYRNFGDHESLVTNHSVNAGSETGVRWYEIRSPGSNPIVFQQGTYAPDSNHRWMASVAMDFSGDIAAGFSVSSSSIHPEIHYTGRLSTDPLGTLPQGEASIIDGAGSQTTTICFPFFICPLTRWGDYTAMQVDPTDDCTFWYTNQYLTDSHTAHWRTRIGSFRFPSCGTGSGPGDFSLQVAPGTASAPIGGSAAYSVCSAVTAGSPDPIQLGLGALPPGASGTFSRNPIPAGSCADLSIATAPSTPVYFSMTGPAAASATASR